MNVRNLALDAGVYLAYVLDIMQTYALRRNQVDWNVLRAQAHERAQGAQTSTDLYAAIRYALSQLGDHHSYLLVPDQATDPRSVTTIDNPSPKGELLEGKLGYIQVPKCSTRDVDQTNSFATQLQHTIRGVDAQKPRGWIIDLRGNEGGNMWGMLAGIGPVLGEGQVGAFVYPDGQVQHWYYGNGEAHLETQFQAKANGAPYQLQAPSPTVALLTDRSTASSGEAIVVAFRARPNTRSFGQRTRGVSTCNQSFRLSDGAILLLSVAVFADRTGQTYGDAIVPDEVVDAQDSERDKVLDTAVKWLWQSIGAQGEPGQARNTN